MKAGFLLVELAFAQNLREKRHVVIVKHLDAFASSFGFFLIGFDLISNYSSPQKISVEFFQITDPVLWFFKFTFASNAATIVGGCLVTNRYKLRLPAAFLSAFVISGIIHPVIARIIWSDSEHSLSPYRFCNESEVSQNYSCNEEMNLGQRLYVLDFAGGGAVHLLGGIAGLTLCLLAKLQKFLDDRAKKTVNEGNQPLHVMVDTREEVQPRNFWEWMYPVDGGGENTSEAALGVFILWFCWFAFNCGSTESVESSPIEPFPFHSIPSFIAINMILAAASGGVIAVLIASWAQLRTQSESVNANEIANGVLSALVAITAGCPFVDYWAACIIGGIAVIIYHGACWLEYKFKIEDTARVVPVHGACGLWSVLAIGIFVGTDTSKCQLHATFEGLCFCTIRLPPLNYGERLLAQIIGALIMVAITSVSCIIMYGLLFLIPMPRIYSQHEGNRCISCYNGCFKWIAKKVFGHEAIKLEGNLLFTGPGEIVTAADRMMRDLARHQSDVNISLSTDGGQTNYGAVPSHEKTTAKCNSGPSRINTVDVLTPKSTNAGSYSRQIVTVDLEDSNEEDENSFTQ
jgi:Amt family ammonium transporter